MLPRPITSLASVSLAALVGCASDVVSVDTDTGTGTGTETGGDEPGPGYCVGTDEPWTTVQSQFPQMTRMWSDGEQLVAHGGDALLTFDGESPSFHLGVTPPTDMRELEATAIDDAWLVGQASVYHWDGASAPAVVNEVVAPDIELAADGQTWLLAHRPCTADQCQPRIWNYQGGDVWDELPVPTRPRAFSFWAGPGGELWLGHDSQVSHRNTDGTWELTNLHDVGYEGAQPHFGFRVGSIDVDAQGNVWMLSDLYGIYLARRDPAGQWVFGIYLASSIGGNTVIADGDQALIHRGDATRSLARWIVGDNGLDDVVSRWQLEIAEFTDVEGPVNQLLVLSPGPRIQSIDAHASPIVAEELLRYPSLAPSPGSAVSVEATFAGRDNVLYRFDGARWDEVLRVPSLSLSADELQGFADIQAVSDDSGWLIGAVAEQPHHHLVGEVLWRWQGDALSEVYWTEPSWVELTHVWPRDLDRAWVFAAPLDKLEIWFINGDELTLEFEWPARALDVTTIDEQVYVVTGDGALLRGDEAGWQAIGDASFEVMPLSVFPSRIELARVGDELLLSVDGYFRDRGFTAFNLRWDGSEWLPMPDTPLFERIAGDGIGRAWAIAGDTLYRHDGQQPADTGWVEVALDGVTAEARIHAADDGVVIHGESTTSWVRWSCD